MHYKTYYEVYKRSALQYVGSDSQNISKCARVPSGSCGMLLSVPVMCKSVDASALITGAQSGIFFPALGHSLSIARATARATCFRDLSHNSVLLAHTLYALLEMTREQGLRLSHGSALPLALHYTRPMQRYALGSVRTRVVQHPRVVRRLLPGSWLRRNRPTEAVQSSEFRVNTSLQTANRLS